MATFSIATGVEGNMLLAFQFATLGIDDITISGGVLGKVTNNTDFNPDLLVTYIAAGSSTLVESPANVPAGGSYDIITIRRGGPTGTLIGDLFGFAAANFRDIDSTLAYKILDGNDTLGGGTLSDTLTGGFGGSDTFNGKGGNDEFRVATLGSAPLHVFKGAAGSTDTVTVLKNIFTAAMSLDLRSSTFTSIDKLALDPGIAVSLKASQFGAGLSASAVIAGGAGSVVTVEKDVPGAVDLRGVTLNGASTVITGSADGEAIFGTKGTDTLIGLDGNDALDGSGGSDTLKGGLGADVLTGGAGAADIFDFDTLAEIGKAKGTRDRIADFEKGLDRIDLSTIDANGAQTGDTAFKLQKKDGADFTDKAGQLHFDKINKPGTANDVTRVEGDTDGNGKADFKLELTGLIKLHADDFVL